jgi:hypothetical protein
VTKSPFHFDLVGLAQGLQKSASLATKMGKLKQHVEEAKKALATHEGHVKEIKELMEKAEGDQKSKLKKVLTSA